MSIRLAGICCLCLACLLHWSPSRAEFVLSAAEAPLEVHCINVACADCILIRQGDHTLMVDSGNLGEADRIVRYLELLGIDRLEYAMETHPHSDHIQGYQEVLRAVDVGTYLRPALFEDYTSADLEALNALLEEKGIPIRTLRHGDTIPFGGAEITCYQWENPEATVNNRSMLLHIRQGERAVLLAADVKNHAQRALAEALGERLRADILKMPHHGLAKFEQAFHDAVQPSLALITNVRGNEAVEQEIKRLETYGVEWMLVTKGNLVAVTDGDSWRIEQTLRPAEEEQKE
ncbi:MAG: MBL fold metallo-hydrolase [Christensenellales bacterium]|uniref:MBL fold metallo-hydrolase n=1 Tax=Candidatus Avichristensenella intestinipullorum TaxID=2840693 RepID=A0A9D0YVM4_9FIRM|nr:MBL fold metallo-hydrolase [Christensenellales bacterium]HIQ62544.1 MBL fold metallo-hydrolase [Candidatus Avichristensenella intestinipullorum]